VAHPTRPQKGLEYLPLGFAPVEAARGAPEARGQVCLAPALGEAVSPPATAREALESEEGVYKLAARPAQAQKAPEVLVLAQKAPEVLVRVPVLGQEV